MSLEDLLDADGLTRAGYDEDSWWDFVEHVAEILDIGPATRVWDVACGAGSFLFPLQQNGYVVGGNDRSTELVERARAAMPDGQFLVGTAPLVATPGRWDVVIASHGLSDCADLDQVRDLVSGMATHATHAVAVLDVDVTVAPHVDQAGMMRALTATGVSAVQFETSPKGRWHVFARVGASS